MYNPYFSSDIHSFIFSFIKQRGKQHHKAGTCVVYQRPGRWVEYLQKREHNRGKIDAHGQGNAEFNRGDRGIGQPFQIGDF